MNSQFTCPVCGSHFFGTTHPNVPGVDLRSPIEQLIGYCKGNEMLSPKGNRLKGNYTGCTFTWPRSDDAKYGFKDHK